MLANLLLLDSLEDYLQERLDVEGLVHELLASQHLLVVQLGLFQVLPNLLLGYLGLSVLVPHAERQGEGVGPADVTEAGNEVVAAGRLRARALGAEAVVRQRLDALVDAALDSFVTQLKVLQVGLELLDHVIISPINQILQLQVIELAGAIVLAASPAEVLSPL